MKHYIPAKEADFVEWSENLITVSEANKTLWNLPDNQLTDLRTLHGQVKGLHSLCNTPACTKLDTQTKNEKKILLLHREEVFVRNNLQNNDAMTDDGRRALQIPVYDRKSTPAPEPSTIPEIKVFTPYPRTLLFKFKDTHAARWGKPNHVHGLELALFIGDAPPAQMKDYTHSYFATSNPLELVFEDDERGKKAYFAARWETNTAKKGKWSEVQFAIIP
ncbi:MAG: hypothetical protein LBK00_03455 [Treponema sp.]|jgi:hypothetical protein|nr:hypothetical protein [Treponema sp.]